MFEILWTDKAKETYESLKNSPSDKVRYRAVKKTIKLLANNPSYPSLRTHPYASLQGPKSETVYESYAQQKTPAAYRVFWYYGPSKRVITIIAITPHP